MLKKTLMVMMASVLLVSGGIRQERASAAMIGSDTVSIQSVYMAKFRVNMSIYNSGVAKVDVMDIESANVTGIDMMVSIQKYNSKTASWSAVKKWETTSKSNSIFLDKKYQLGAKGKYRVRVSATLWNDKNSEKITKLSKVVVY